MRRLFDGLVSWLLSVAPWYRPAEITAREGKTERTRQHSITARIRAERVIAEYRMASESAGRAGERLIRETRRDGR